MRLSDYTRDALAKIDSYLKGTLSAADVSDWAEKVVESKDWDSLPKKTQEVIHALFDLHDVGEKWAPQQEELRRFARMLQEPSAPSAQ